MLRNSSRHGRKYSDKINKIKSEDEYFEGDRQPRYLSDIQSKVHLICCALKRCTWKWEGLVTAPKVSSFIVVLSSEIPP
jgi:hypothetical protein